MSTGLPTLAVAGRNDCSRARVSGENSATARPAASHASTARIPGPPAFVIDGHAVARRERLRVEQSRDVEHLVDRLGADHAGLMEQRVDGGVAGGEGRRVAAGCARSGARCVRLSRRRSASAARRAGRFGRTAAGFRTIRDTGG